MEPAITNTAIVTINADALPTILSADNNDILGKLMAELGNFDPDGSTEAGRKECASKARKVSVAKADLIRLAETLKADAANVVKGVNAEVKIVESRMDELRDRFLAPVEEYRNREKARVYGHEAFIAEFGEMIGRANMATMASCAPSNIRRIIAACGDANTSREEFTKRAEAAKAETMERLLSILAEAERREAETAELARLRAEAEARRQREHDEAIAAKARAEAEAKAAHEAETARLAAERERHRIEQESAAREARAKAEQDARDRKAAEVLAQAERDRQAAIDAAAKAERDRVAAAEKVEQDRIAAEAVANRREQEAAERERAKIAAQQKAEADERARRLADIDHQRIINSAAYDGFIAIGFPTDFAKSAVTAIIRGHIPNVSIRY